ncbi:MAG: tetratricopeptide repeat protein [Alphaproteobacteria bacterium]|nr:tetratricopeptide repeat protein [Alphaproteobacteria bacterium]
MAALAAPAAANVGDADALAAYVRARVAEAGGNPTDVAHRYGAALTASDGNQIVAGRALTQAIAAGDEALALRAAAALDRAGELPVEGRLLRYEAALKARNWSAANAAADSLAKDEVFSFLPPLLRAWTAQASGKGDSFAPLADPRLAPAGAYVAEQRPLLLAAAGRRAEAVEAAKLVAAAADGRAERLRMAVAAVLVRQGGKAEALATLAGGSDVLAAARARVEAGQPLAGADTPAAAGIALLFLAVSRDLNAQEVRAPALTFARLATFAAPQLSGGWTMAAELLAARGETDAAMAALDHVARGDPFEAAAASRRLELLVQAGRKTEALAAARAAAERAPHDVEAWTALADIETQTGAHREAAAALDKAIALAAGGETNRPEWALQVMRGNALLQAGDWPAARAALERANALAPNQPVVMNFLGYTQLERRENMAAATALIERASALQPDDAAITDSLGWAYYIRGELPRAIPLLEKAAQGQPADAAINEHLGDAYYAAGRRFDARYAWRAALVYAEGKAVERLKAKIDLGLTTALAAP